jgi:hypothetical protein
MKLLIVAAAAAALALGGCAGVKDVINNPNCTTKVAGKVAFGSITPTGEASYSAVCRPVKSNVAPGEVVAPKEPPPAPIVKDSG